MMTLGWALFGERPGLLIIPPTDFLGACMSDARHSIDVSEKICCAKRRKEVVKILGRTRAEGEISQAPGAHCTRKSPLPLLPSGPGGVGGSTSRKTDA